MQESLKNISIEHKERSWIQAGKNILNEKLRGDKNLEESAKEIIEFLVEYLSFQLGAFYSTENSVSTLRYSYGMNGKPKEIISEGEGLIGQVASDKKAKYFVKVPKNYFKISSSAGQVLPDSLVIYPVLFNSTVIAIFELAKFGAINPLEMQLLDELHETIALCVNAGAKKQKLEILAELIELANDAIILRSLRNSEMIFWNKGAEAQYGWSKAEVIGNSSHTFLDTIFPENEDVKQIEKQLFETGKWAGELNHKTKHSGRIIVFSRWALIRDSQGKPESILEINSNITQQKEQQARLTQLAGELQAQQEELKQINEELEEQTQNLKQQQEELQMTNEELEAQTLSLEAKNKEAELAKYEVEQKTKQLEISGRYKSEFLANMSHELRTPLNSLLILSKDLADNKKKNLDDNQVESAEIIYKSGTDLLRLINEVLDLSKIEAGKMSITNESVYLKTIHDELVRDFKHHAEQKGLKLTSSLGNGLPEMIRTDSQRLNQILKNLLSNAIKFTSKGGVHISFEPYNDTKLIIAITDTGIGIPVDKQMAIFEAFQQADGGTSRKYGGSGLGLSISRELARLLSAEINLRSSPGKGSTFSVILPFELHHEHEPAGETLLAESGLFDAKSAIDPRYLNYHSINDDRNSIGKDDKTVLIIEDDLRFASMLLNLANYKGFKCIAASSGEDGLFLAEKFKPHAIILDMHLPGMQGGEVILKLKGNPVVRHIPVHIVSAKERSLEPIKDGAIEYLVKPVSKQDLEEVFNRIENFVNRKMKTLLIIEDNEIARKAMIKLIGNGDVKCLEADTGKVALAAFKKNVIDCIVLDLGLPDMSGFELIQKLKNSKGHTLPPIIIYTGKDLTREESNELQNYAESIIIKGIKSEERLLDETALFLHRTISQLPESKQVIIKNLYDIDDIFISKKILLADDDMRNVFALSKILKERGIDVIKAENGKVAMKMLDENPGIDLVLMDIMMPEMDGYEALKLIRSKDKFLKLPIIALTAKAMQDDKQKCIEAGANDYISKPVEIDRLLSLMRIWLSK